MPDFLPPLEIGLLVSSLRAAYFVSLFISFLWLSSTSHFPKTKLFPESTLTRLFLTPLFCERKNICKNAFFMPNFFLFFNIIFFDFYILRPTLFQFLYPPGKVGSFKAFKILIHSGDNLLVRKKTLPPEPVIFHAEYYAPHLLRSRRSQLFHTPLFGDLTWRFDGFFQSFSNSKQCSTLVQCPRELHSTRLWFA